MITTNHQLYYMALPTIAVNAHSCITSADNYIHILTENRELTRVSTCTTNKHEKLQLLVSNIYLGLFCIDNHRSGYPRMAGCSIVCKAKSGSKLTHFQPTLSWFQTVSGSNQLYQPLLQSSLSQNIKLQLRKPLMYTTASKMYRDRILPHFV